MNKYRSPYEAYPFLSDDSNDFRCDFELLTDEMASQVGLLRSLINDESLKDDLLWIIELLYHINPTLRTKFTITEEELKKLKEFYESLKNQYEDKNFTFVLPQGSQAASLAHILRVQAKKLVRLIYRYIEQGNEVNPELIDLANLLSGYFFYLALEINKKEGNEEIEFRSRNY